MNDRSFIYMSVVKCGDTNNYLKMNDRSFIIYLLLTTGILTIMVSELNFHFRLTHSDTSFYLHTSSLLVEHKYCSVRFLNAFKKISDVTSYHLGNHEGGIRRFVNCFLKVFINSESDKVKFDQNNAKSKLGRMAGLNHFYMTKKHI